MGSSHANATVQVAIAEPRQAGINSDMDIVVEVAREPTLPERSLAVRRAAARLCLQMGWSPVHEVPAVLPPDTGLIVACGPEAEMLRDAPPHPLAPARRRALMQRFAIIAAQRLAWLEDPAAMNGIRTALRAE